jgi:hypothetical protein
MCCIFVLLNFKNNSVMNTKVKTGLTPAQKVIETYPTFTEIFEYALNNVGGLRGGMTHRFYLTLPEQYRWEAVSDLVDLMVENRLGRPFHKYYAVRVNKNTGFSSRKDCNASVYDYTKKEHKVTGDEFLALLKIMAIHWMNPLSVEGSMIDVYDEFRASSIKINTILD